ncbi:MAG: nitrilase family protein [Bacteroidia bacterium]|nr:nitrilase family protein [Bacteroidia bacterium]
MKIAIVQTDIIWENPAENRAKIERLLSLQSEKADIIILPEMFSTGFTMNAPKNAEKMGGETCVWMDEIALKYKCILMGSLIIEEDGGFYNRMIITNGQKFNTYYDKRHLFRMAGEDLNYTPGETQLHLNVKGWKINVLICYDLRFPVWCRNRTNSDGESEYDILVYVANWPERRIHHWDKLLVARAIENQSFVIGVNRTGKDGNDINYTGNSAAIDFTGEYLWKDSEGKEGVYYVNLERSGLLEYRKRFPVWQDADEFKLL